MICFISGGITNVPRYLHLFRVAVSQVKSLGFVPFDPAAMSFPLLQDGVVFENDQWLEIDLQALKFCQCVYHLKGWQLSTGSSKEHAFALKNDIPILYQSKYTQYKESGLSPEEIVKAELAGGFT